MFDHLSGDHITGGPNGFVLIESRQEGFLVEVEVVHLAWLGLLLRLWLLRWSLTTSLLIGGAEQISHRHASHRIGGIDIASPRAGRLLRAFKASLHLLLRCCFGLPALLRFALSALLFLLFIDRQDGEGLLQ